MFSNSPRDPRYHMLSHISAKFKQPSKAQQHEPRAALFLNRFTRTLTIMYATSGLQEVIGIPAETMRGRSFYYCIAENCLQDAVKCLENAKGNDSIAYLRFWFRDPRIDDNQPPPDDDSDEEMTGTEMSTEMSEDGGVNLQSPSATSPESAGSTSSNALQSSHSMEMDSLEEENQPNSRTSSGDSTNERDTHEAIFGQSLRAEESTSSLEASPERSRHASQQPQQHQTNDPIEIEAVISCTSDGLVVCLRKARPMIPHPTHRPSRAVYENGLFAAPWAQEPMLPPLEARPGAGFGNTFAPSLGPQGARAHAASPVRAGGPDNHDFMSAIRDQAVFAWALTGINGSLAEYAVGKPMGESSPEDGYPVWASDPRQHSSSRDHSVGSGNGSSNGYQSGQDMSGMSNSRSPQETRLGPQIFGDPGLSRDGSRSANSNGNGNGNGHGNGYGHSAGGTPFVR